MKPELILSPSDFVALVNQTLEFAYPLTVIQGELANFRVSKNRWVYFDLIDEGASVKFFGTVYMLPGPLEDGLMLKVVGSPRLHPRFGFSVNVQTMAPVGEGSLKKAADLLTKKLAAEGLFAPERKRLLPELPDKIGLITADGSAAYHDFIKILNGQWGGVEVLFHDSLVQGEQAPGQLIQAIDNLNQSAEAPDVLVITRGGGSAEDLAAFNDERVVRAVAASRAPTLIAIGHEVDISLAELAADARASTPTNAAQMVVPDRSQVLSSLGGLRQLLGNQIANHYDNRLTQLSIHKKDLTTWLNDELAAAADFVAAQKRLARLFDPRAALKRGYAIITKAGRHINSSRQVSPGDRLKLEVADGKINATVTEAN